MISRRRVLIALALAAAMVMVVAPAAAQQKIGVIDVQRILSDSLKGKAVVELLEQIKSDRQAELKTANDELVELDGRIRVGELSLAEDKLVDLRNELETKNRDFQRAQEDARREIQRRSEQEIQKVEAEILPIIAAVGQELGYSLIFNKYQSGLVFAADETDLTDLVLQRFDAAADAN